MAEKVNVHQAKTHLSRLLEKVGRGEEVVICKGGKPCARLVPVVLPEERPLGFVPGRVTEDFFSPLPEEELASWE